MRRAIRQRLRVLMIVLAIIALLLVIRLYFVQIVHGSGYALRAQHQYISSSQELYDRGTVYFTRRDGTLISAATVTTGFLVSINPEQLTNPDSAYSALNAIIPIDKPAFFASAAKKNDPYEIVAHHVSTADGKAISALKITGVSVTLERWRAYPGATEAAQSLGIVAYDNDNTLAGRFGLERYYNDVLDRSNTGLFGNFFAELFANIDSVVVDARSAREGDVVTSIEPVVEQKLDQTLFAVQAQYHSQETGGIIMDPSTGEIIALDTVPSFDPNHFSTEDSNNFGNPLVEHEYEFGSIFKMLTMASGLDAGVIQPDSTYDDTGCITVDKSKICNYDLRARGVIPMQQILSQSLNVGASYIATALGHQRFRDYFSKLGLGIKTGIDLPSEVQGNIHNIQTSPRDVEYDTAAFGQGIATTPVATIRALASLANHGAIVTPHLATSIRLQSGVVRDLTWPAPVQVFKPATTDEVTSMLVTVVDKSLANGTVMIPEMSVAAKTGTAQIAGPGGKYYANLYFHSFFGYFPAYNPRFAILLYTREPQNVEYASETLTLPFMGLTHFLINYYSIPPDRASYSQ